MASLKDDPLFKVIRNGIGEDIKVVLSAKRFRAATMLIYAGMDAMAALSRRAGQDDVIGQLVRQLARKAGVKLTMKSLRRGFGCYWASRVPARVLQKLMRHSNIRVTMDYYANVDDAAMEAVLGRKRNSSRNSGQHKPTHSDTASSAYPDETTAT